MSKKSDIPKIQPFQFDHYMFSSPKRHNNSLFERFHIEPIEEYKKSINLPLLPHRRSIYFFLFVTQGVAVRSKSLNQYEIEANHFFCLPAYQITSIKSFSADLKGFYCHFKADIFHQSQLNINIEKDFPIFDIMAEPLVKISNPERFMQVLSILSEEYKRNRVDRINIIAHYMTSLFNEVNFEYTKSTGKFSNAASLITQQYKSLLSQNISQIKKVADCAQMLEITPNHLNKSVKEVTGKTANEILADMRLLEAKVLLRQSNLRVSEIAFKVGGFDPSDFSRFFKTKTGMSPKAYRNSEKL
ncbi:MAG: helix-turn-helix domain-containing protein [Saprospiraceae bacterium]